MASPYDLVVIHPFDAYQRGQKLTDQGEVDAILGGDNAHHVHKVEGSAPAPVAPPAAPVFTTNAFKE